MSILNRTFSITKGAVFGAVLTLGLTGLSTQSAFAYGYSLSENEIREPAGPWWVEGDLGLDGLSNNSTPTLGVNIGYELDLMNHIGGLSHFATNSQGRTYSVQQLFWRHFLSPKYSSIYVQPSIGFGTIAGQIQFVSQIGLGLRTLLNRDFSIGGQIGLQLITNAGSNRGVDVGGRVALDPVFNFGAGYHF